MVKINTYHVATALVFALFLLLQPCRAQQGYHLNVMYVDSGSTFIHKTPLQTHFTNKLTCNEYLVKLKPHLIDKGFIAASIDSIYHTPDNTVIHLFLGPQYQFIQLDIMPQDKFIVKDLFGKTKGLKGNTIKYSDYQKIADKILDHYEDKGYAFATVSLDSMVLDDTVIKAKLIVQPGNLYKIDSIRTLGTAKISKNFLYHHVGIEKGSFFSRQKLNKISQRISELPYLQQTAPWQLDMLSTGSIVNLYLQPKKSNQINVLAGFLPANQQLGGKLLFTIDANLKLQNAFSTGESVGIIWQQIQPRSPRLNLQYNQPFIFNSAFGADLLFDLLKKDSLFLNINAQLGIVYMLSTSQSGKVILQTQQTNILNTDTILLKRTRKLPLFNDVKSVNIGAEYELNNTDYRFNPRKGNELLISATAGNKTIKKNNAVLQIKDPQFDYSTLYDSLQLKTYQLRFKLKAARYFSIGKQSVFKTAINAGLLQSPQLFANELFQIGGFKTLRGVDEESIYTNRYFIFTAEYRYLILQNSNFYVFTDLGYSSNRVQNISNTYIGTGLGLSFETKGGIFNLAYAVGKRNDLNLDIRQSKIHFGWVSIF